MHREQKRKNWTGTALSVLLFLVALVILALGTSRLQSGAGREGLAATQQAVQRAAVLCYATEGYYPPSLTFIEDRYGVQIDHNRYVVHYEVIASNVMPVIRVASW